MYFDYFGFRQAPFSIAPNPELLFPSRNHQEALAHLHYALTGQAGLLCLTGEVGTGKTTLCRAFLRNLPDQVRSAYVFNPELSALELLQTLCEEFGISVPPAASSRDLYSLLNHELLAGYGRGERFICIIDEAQRMPAPLLEQVRLLTNLETDHEKLLTVILVGQPELNTLLARYELRQLNQRIGARFHLSQLSFADTRRYLAFRCAKAGAADRLFSFTAACYLWRKSRGVPRLLNLLADRALLGAYAHSQKKVSRAFAKGAAQEILLPAPSFAQTKWWVLGLLLLAAVIGWLRFAPNVSELMLMPNWAATHSLAAPQSPAAQNPAAQSPAAQAIGAGASPVSLLSQALNLPPAAHCQALPLGWRCLWLNLPLGALLQLPMPVMVKLDTDMGPRWQLLDAEVRPEQYQQQALVLWQPPLGYQDQLVRPNERSELVGWVRLKMDMQDASWQRIGPTVGEKQTAQLDAHFYDPLLAQKVEEFQHRWGLSGDRILGPKTLFLLWAREG